MTYRLGALLEVLPLQIPALRHSSMDARSDSGAQHGGAAQRSAASSPRNPLSGKGRIPYVKLCGLRLPDTLTPAVDEPHEAQVGACIGTSWLGCRWTSFLLVGLSSLCTTWLKS